MQQIGIYAKKVGMTQIFKNNGNAYPVSVLHVYPTTILEIKQINNLTDHILVGSNTSLKKNEKNIKKSLRGFFIKKKLAFFNHIKEYKINKNAYNFKENDALNIDYFKIGEKLKISGLSLGKGTQGNIKRNNFNRGPMTHGSKHHRLQGSLGAGTTPSRVFPGKKMSGRMGNEKKTIFGLEILDICYENNLLAIKGSVPGKFNNLLYIEKIQNYVN